jgi:hypothetical protein
METTSAETSGLAIVAMMFTVLLIGVPVQGQLISLLFVWRAHVDVRRSEGYLRGAELARAAEIVSVVLLVFYLLAAAVFVAGYMTLRSMVH